MNQVEIVVMRLLERLADAIPALLKAIILLLVGTFLIRTLLKVLRNRFEARNVDLSIRGFLLSIIKFMLYGLLILSVVQSLGFQTTSILAAFSAFALAAGMALQGSLSNFAGGVLILLFRPFEVGDSIEGNGVSGTVERIDLLYTSIRTSAGTLQFSPNGALANSVIHNLTKTENRRMETQITISYDANIQQAKTAITQALATDSAILSTPAPDVSVANLTDAGVVLSVKVWASRDEFAAVQPRFYELIKTAIDTANVPRSAVPKLEVLTPKKEA